MFIRDNVFQEATSTKAKTSHLFHKKKKEKKKEEKKQKRKGREKKKNGKEVKVKIQKRFLSGSPIVRFFSDSYLNVFLVSVFDSKKEKEEVKAEEMKF